MSKRKTNENLTIKIKKNKDGSYNKNDMRRYNNAMFIQHELSEYDNFELVYLHHSAIHSGYIPRNSCRIRKYNGRFGVGYTVDVPNFKQGNIFERRYYLFKKPEKSERY